MTSSWRVVHFDEDETALRRAAAALETEHDGVEVFTTTDADAALGRLAGESVDCVVTEFAPSVVRRLATAHPDVPCVLFTAVDNVPVEALTTDVAAVVPKGDGDDESFAALARRVVDVVEARGGEAVETRHGGAEPTTTREERLQRSEAIVENMDDVAYTVDESLTLTYANPRALEYAEMAREDVVGESIEHLCERMLVDPAQTERLSDVLRAVVTGESDGDRLELELDLPRGRVFAEQQMSPLRTPDGESLHGAVVISRDVTERTKQKRELERQNERLDTFTSIVSHDLRGPLSVAEGNLELAKTECDSDRLDAVARAHDRMEALIEGLLTVARQGTPVEDPEPVDVDAVARQSWEFVEAEDATVEVDTGLVVGADEQRLHQLFENLFRNSVEHRSTGPHSQARDGGAEPRSASSRTESDDSVEHSSPSSRPAAGDITERRSVSSQNATRSDDSVEHGSTPDSPSDGDGTGDTDRHTGVQVRVGALDDGAGFYVEDDGPGVAPEDRDDVFEAGYSTKPGGTGLGLMILREIADAHGWDLTLTEGSMGGARFEVRNVNVVAE